MTTFDLPPIPAELMDDQPITAEDFEAAAEALVKFDADGIGELTEIVQVSSAGPDEPVLPDAVSRFRVTDDGAAEWALRKIAEMRARRAEVGAQAQGWRDEIDRWESQQVRAPMAFEDFLTGHLEAYMRARVEDDPKLRTVSLPSGKIKATAHKPKVGLSDSPDQLLELIAWVDENLDPVTAAVVVQTVRKPMISALAKLTEPSTERVGDRHSFELACGHTFEQFVPADHPECFEPYAIGDPMACHACLPDFGEQPEREVESVTVTPVEEPVVRLADTGHVIPGAVVVPPSVSFSVKVGG